MKLSNLSVGLRLGASFGAILLITALIAATGMWRIASLQQRQRARGHAGDRAADPGGELGRRTSA